MSPTEPLEPQPEPEPEEVPVGARKAYYVELSREVYVAVMDALPAVCRFVNTDWSIPHFWLYDAEGKIVIFSHVAVQKLESVSVGGFPEVVTTVVS